jgi:hypothetical protein
MMAGPVEIQVEMPTPELKRRWFYLSPDRFVAGLLLVVCLLWLSDRFQWFGFNHHEGWTVLIAVATVGVAAVTMLLWWAAALIFARRFQFGIRSLLAFCLACSIAAAWFAVEMKRARRQAKVVEAITTLDGLWQYDWQLDADGGLLLNARPPGPGWLINLLGSDFFAEVANINLRSRPVTDAELEQFEGMTRINGLEIGNTGITDAGLRHIIGMTRLFELDIGSTQITDTGLQYLEGMTQLQRLALEGTQITDVGVERLKCLIQLKTLSLGSDTRITDAGLEHLKGLRQLEFLFLDGAQITDAGLEHIRGLTHLKQLFLEGTQITDAGLEHLKGMTQLELLYLTGTKVTDAGLEHLRGFVRLKQLRLSGTHVTDAGIRKLMQALPHAVIMPLPAVTP